MTVFKTSIEPDWKTEARDARAEAEQLPEGQQKDELLKKARQLDTASKMHGWMDSPGLKSPSGR